MRPSLSLGFLRLTALDVDTWWWELGTDELAWWHRTAPWFFRALRGAVPGGPCCGLGLLCACLVREPAHPFGAGAPGRRARVLACISDEQPLTVPDRTVDVRLCTERRAGREGEGEPSAQQRGCEFQINLLLC